MKVSDAIVAESPHPKWDSPPLIDQSCLVFGDSQSPFIDAQFINHIKEIAFAYGVKQAVWAGDMIDLHAVSIFLSQRKQELHVELDEDEIMLGSIASGFENVLWLNGNHDIRISRALEAYLPLDRVRKMLGLDDNVKTTDYYYCYIGDRWMATHPKNSSVIPGRVPAVLAQKYRRNTLSFHGHLVGAVMTNGYWCVDVGVTCDPARLEYSSVVQTTRPLVQRGAALLLKGLDGEWRIRLLNDLTDWTHEKLCGEAWLKYQTPPALISQPITRARKRKRAKK